jgi:putative hydrolase of the HAD superfamily
MRETKLNILPADSTSCVLRMEKTTVLFDLGGTLVHYYERAEFPAILEHAIAQVQSLLEKKGLLTVTPDAVRARVRNEDHESPDNRSRPLENRLIRIFDIDNSVRTDELVSEMCRCFVRPIFARSRCYQDTFPVLRELRARSFRTAIVSNTSWGSPAFLWRDEVKRIGLIEHMDALVFDRDVGWRKPSRQIFEFALKKLQVRPDECVFVGDEPRWDVEGSRALGMDAILVDRLRNAPIAEERTVKHLSDLLPILSRR